MNIVFGMSEYMVIVIDYGVVFIFIVLLGLDNFDVCE